MKDKWVKKIWYIHTMEILAIKNEIGLSGEIWMGLSYRMKSVRKSKTRNLEKWYM